MTDAQESEALRQSMLKWMKWGVVGLLAILTLAFPIAPLGTFIALPGFLSWAGADVTAAGVLNDIVAIAVQEKRALNRAHPLPRGEGRASVTRQRRKS